MHAQTFRCLHAAFDLEPLYTGLYNPRWLPTPDENTPEISVNVESLRLEILFSEPPPPPQDDLSPRRSHTAGTGLDEPGVPHAMTQQTKQEGFFSLQASADGFLRVDCTRTLEHEGTLSFQADVGVKPEETTAAQVAAREEFARPLKNRQRQRVTA